MLGNPQSHFLTPWFLLTLIFGPFIGLRLEIPVYIAIAWSGAYVLARVAGTRPIAALAAAFLFATSSWFYVRVTAGILAMCGFAYLPWVIAGCWVAARRHQPRYAAISGAILALSFLECGPYPAVYGLIGIGVLMLSVSVLDRTAYPLRTAIVAGLFTLGFASVKRVPAMLLAAAHGRPTGGAFEVNTFQVLREGLFSPVQNLFRGSSNGWGFWETSAYIGGFWIPALLAVNSPRRVAPWLITAVIIYALAQGDAGLLWPWATACRSCRPCGFHRGF